MSKHGGGFSKHVSGEGEHMNPFIDAIKRKKKKKKKHGTGAEHK